MTFSLFLVAVAATAAGYLPLGWSAASPPAAPSDTGDAPAWGQWPAAPRPPAAPTAPDPDPSSVGGADPGSASQAGGPTARRRLAVIPRFAFRAGEPGRAVPPATGYGLAGTVEAIYFRTRPPAAGPVAEAAVGVDFSFDRFPTREVGSVIADGTARTFSSTRVISETSFVLVHTLALRLARLRPHLAVGAGLGLGYFDSVAESLQPGTTTDTHLLGRASLGLDVAMARTWGVVVRADYTAVRAASPFRTADGRSLALFGDIVTVGAGIAYLF